MLKEGAGAIYGSDAIGGVVNFITRKDVEGLEITGDYGKTTRNDGQHHTIGLLFGTNTDKFSIQVGGNLFQQDAVYATRDYSKYALYLYGGTTGVTKGGSSRVPTGRIFTNPLGLTGTNGKVCSSLTRIAADPGTALTDYRCYNSPADNFNYQPLNLIQTPIERTSMFAKTNYKINDDVEAYASVTHTHTVSGFHEAPLPFDSLADNIVLSKNSIYNPFGIDFGGNSGTNPDFTLRTFLFGARESDSSSDGDVFNGGVKGKIDAIDWNWDLNLSYSRLQQHETVSGYYFGDKLQAAVGPSFFAADGTPTCGTPTAPIAGCTPINLFNQYAPSNAAALSGVDADYNVDNLYLPGRGAGLQWRIPVAGRRSAGGGRIQLRQPGGQVPSGSPGAGIAAPVSDLRTVAGDLHGSGHRRVQQQTGIPGTVRPPSEGPPAGPRLERGPRSADNDYSAFGASTKADFKVEYRPVKDLLLRGTFSQVLRVPR